MLDIIRNPLGRLGIRPEEYCTEATDLDTLYWESVRTESPLMQEAFPGRGDSVIGGDLFNTLYQYNPQVRPDPPDNRLARLLGRVMQTTAWMDLHQATQGDPKLSAAGTLNMKRHLDEVPDNDPGRKMLERLARLKDLESMAQGYKDAQDLVDSLEIKEALERAAAEKAAQAKALTEEIDRDFADPQVEEAAAQCLRAAAEKANEIMQRAQGVLGSGWDDEPGELTEIMFDPESVRLLDQARVKQILALVGRMRMVVSAQRAKRLKPGPRQIRITTGDDLGRMLPSEAGLLLMPETEGLFLQRYAEQGIMQYEHKERPREGRGPFVILVDESGSMSEGTGDKIVWAKALGLSLASQAQREGREFACASFADTRNYSATLNPRGDGLLEWLVHFFGGGTNFEMALEHTVIGQVDFATPDGKVTKNTSLLRELPEGADVVMITDGVCDVSPQFQEEFKRAKHEIGARLIGIQIGLHPVDTLRKVCDTVHRLTARDIGDGLAAVIEELR